MYEDDERYCRICYTDLEEDDDGYVLRDGSLICRYCLQKNSEKCEKCGDYFHREEMKSWDDHVWYCSECFEKMLSVTPTEDALAQEACEEMGKRLKGMKTNEKACVFDIEDDMNESHIQCIDVWIDDNGRIYKTGRYKHSKLFCDGEGYEEWVEVPDRPEDYAKNGEVEDLIYRWLVADDEEEKNIETAVNERILEEFTRQINEKKEELDQINQQKEKIRKEIELLEEMLERM